MSAPVDLQDFVAGFLLEAEEHLHSVNRNLVATAEALKKGQPEPRAVRELFRSLHTIKGLSAMVGAEPIVDISHEMEGLLRTADRSGGRLSEQVLDLILQGTRAVEERVRGISQSGIQAIAKAPQGLVEALLKAQSGNSQLRTDLSWELSLPKEILSGLTASDREQIIQATKLRRRALLVEFEPSPEKVASGINITSVREELAKIGELIKVVPKSSSTAPTGISFCLLMVTDSPNDVLEKIIADDSSAIEDIVATDTEPLAAKTPHANSENSNAAEVEWLPSDQSSIRVDVRRLDDALEQLSSLFVTRFKLDRVAADLHARGVDVRELKSVISENARQLRRLRTAISEARMVPLAELLQRLPLVVRGITRESEKSVNVNILAGSAEVDKSVADKIFPAVVHLVRNAVDHAIETRAERKKKAKPEAGELTIRCDDSSGTNLVLTVSDDGSGINFEAVAKKANRSVATTSEELLDQICTAGLSTNESVTLTSGRGMGMDIVRRTVELLGGSLALETSPAQGTTFTMTVPVTVTIVDVLSFVAGGQAFVTPLSMVDEIIELEAGLAIDLPSTVHDTTPTQLIQHRGRTIPLFTLQSVLERSVVRHAPLKALIINNSRGTVAFGVDRMIGQQEAVVRPLDDVLVRTSGMSGATDLGDGKPTLMLDLAVLAVSTLKKVVANS